MPPNISTRPKPLKVGVLHSIALAQCVLATQLALSGIDPASKFFRNLVEMIFEAPLRHPLEETPILFFELDRLVSKVPVTCHVASWVLGFQVRRN